MFYLGCHNTIHHSTRYPYRTEIHLWSPYVATDMWYLNLVTYGSQVPHLYLVHTQACIRV